ncbi:MAG: alpha-hydroxy-acid oxidizing protein [Ktedonobacteraceae bacterium]|nr:alpha-hydroxy-acid oxidizing protein [Ktedonobacteraceae bacterium]
MTPINLFDYEALAQQRMSPVIWDYFQGGSDDEVTLRNNRSAFERIRLRPRMLIDVDNVQMQTSVVGVPIQMPVVVAPVAAHALAHPEGELATARGTGQAGTILTVSTFSTYSIEEIAAVATGPLWLQLYLTRTMEATGSLIQRAEDAGYRAIVLTVDTPRTSRRERDVRNNFMVAKVAHAANFVEAGGTDPVTVQQNRHISGTWETLDWLRSLTKLPILLKGILTAEDALLAMEHDIQGIVVSNHGGRQLDGAIEGIEALPEVVEAVAGRCEVYVDGGIRRGTDVLKALALGARAVLVGRPALWGLAVNGAEGVHSVLEMLRAELEMAMVLAGHPTVASIDRGLVKKG